MKRRAILTAAFLIGITILLISGRPVHAQSGSTTGGSISGGQPFGTGGAIPPGGLWHPETVTGFHKITRIRSTLPHASNSRSRMRHRFH
jgi:hypothetical protein